jgi:hypothetical protein
MRYRFNPRVTLGLLVLVGLAFFVIPSTSADASGSGAKVLVGTFDLNAGSCSGTNPTGTYFRMIYPGGTIAAGKFFENPDSTCTTDQSYTLASPGSQGGLTNGKYQADPTPVFASTGSALASSIIEPQAFTQINFSIATNPTDPQTGLAVPAPLIKDKNGKLSGQVEAWSADWNNLHFNQGSPKPGGAKPGLTQAVSGTYNAKTHAFVLIWASAVVGGPFNGFTGYWHLQGTFKPKK